ncbi:hypothetical protein ACHAWF_018039, partial [Thalassiosira exigua]
MKKPDEAKQDIVEDANRERDEVLAGVKSKDLCAEGVAPLPTPACGSTDPVLALDPAPAWIRADAAASYLPDAKAHLDAAKEAAADLDAVIASRKVEELSKSAEEQEAREFAEHLGRGRKDAEEAEAGIARAKEELAAAVEYKAGAATWRAKVLPDIVEAKKLGHVVKGAYERAQEEANDFAASSYEELALEMRKLEEADREQDEILAADPLLERLRFESSPTSTATRSSKRHGLSVRVQHVQEARLRDEDKARKVEEEARAARRAREEEARKARRVEEQLVRESTKKAKSRSSKGGDEDAAARRKRKEDEARHKLRNSSLETICGDEYGQSCIRSNLSQFILPVKDLEQRRQQQQRLEPSASRGEHPGNMCGYENRIRNNHFGVCLASILVFNTLSEIFVAVPRGGGEGEGASLRRHGPRP